MPRAQSIQLGIMRRSSAANSFPWDGEGVTNAIYDRRRSLRRANRISAALPSLDASQLIHFSLGFNLDMANSFESACKQGGGM